MNGDNIPADEPYDPVRAAQYETFVERTAPPPKNPFRCSCDRCYGRRWRAA